MWDKSGTVLVPFAYGPTRLAPTHPVSIPRLEEGIEGDRYGNHTRRLLYRFEGRFGYITNESKRFYEYVANRVQLIRSLSTPSQWRYVESENNATDLATRGVKANKLMESSWLSGPEFLKSDDTAATPGDVAALNEDDPEVKKKVDAFVTKFKPNQKVSHGLGAKRFE